MLQNASKPGPTCIAANTRADKSAALIISGRIIWAEIAVYSPAWNFSKSIGVSHLLGYKEGSTMQNSEYNGHYVYVWTGDDPQIAFALVTPSPGKDLVLTDIHGQELTSFPMQGYEAAYEAFAACVFGR